MDKLDAVIDALHEYREELLKLWEEAAAIKEDTQNPSNTPWWQKKTELTDTEREMLSERLSEARGRKYAYNQASYLLDKVFEAIDGEGFED